MSVRSDVDLYSWKKLLQPNDFDLALHRLELGIPGVYFRLFSLRQRRCKTIRQRHLFRHFQLTGKLRQFLPRRNYLEGQTQEPRPHLPPCRKADFSFYDAAHFGPIRRRNQESGIRLRCFFQHSQNLLVARLREQKSEYGKAIEHDAWQTSCPLVFCPASAPSVARRSPTSSSSTCRPNCEYAPSSPVERAL